MKEQNVSALVSWFFCLQHAEAIHKPEIDPDQKIKNEIGLTIWNQLVA
jgi:hypothetical protein